MKLVWWLFGAMLVFSCAASVASYSRIGQTAKSPPRKIYEPKEVDQKAKILSRQEPQYTEQARRNHTSGTVILKVVLQASGEIGEIKVMSELPDGLTEECIRVARLVKFEPAVKNGTPVSQYSRFQYFFNAD
jgi:TonB family protein